MKFDRKFTWVDWGIAIIVGGMLLWGAVVIVGLIAKGVAH